MLPAAGDEDDLIGPVTEFFLQVVDEQVDAAVLANNTGQRLAADRRCRGKITASTRSIHSRQRSSGGKSTSSRSRRYSSPAFACPVRLLPYDGLAASDSAIVTTH